MKLSVKNCLKIGLALFLLYLAIHYWGPVSQFAVSLIGAASPLLIGCTIAYIVNILLTRYESWFFPRSQKKIVQKTRRGVCLLASYLTVAIIIALVVILVVPQLLACIRLIVEKLPGIILDGVKFLSDSDLLSDDSVSTLSQIDWQSRIGQILSVVGTGIGSVVDAVISTLTSVFSGVVSAILALIFSVYLLISKETIARQLKKAARKIVPQTLRRTARHVLDVLHASFRGFIVGQCTEALILGVLCTLGMWALGLPYPTMIGAFVAFAALIPIAGAYIGAITGALMILTVDPVQALIFVVFFIILQQLEGNLIYPRVVGSSIGLPGIWVLAAVTIGGGIAGVPGMLFGVPITAALYRLSREYVNKKKEESL